VGHIAKRWLPATDKLPPFTLSAGPQGRSRRATPRHCRAMPRRTASATSPCA